LPPTIFEFFGSANSTISLPLALRVIAGLDPAIHLLAKMMDARVKPGHDSSFSGDQYTRGFGGMY
jgi:hypothetical protein